MQGPKRIIVHAGFHKTGTSTVQRGLDQMRETLMPYAQVVLKSDIGYLTKACQTYARAPESAALDQVRTHATAFFSMLQGEALPVVVSAEDLSGVMPGRAEVQSYGAAPDIMLALEQAARNALGPTPELIFYFSTRAADSWIRSLWWQHITATRFAVDFDGYHEDARQGADLSTIVDLVAERVDATVLSRSLDELTDTEYGPLTPIFDLLTVPLEARFEAASENTRPDLGLEEVFLALNRSGLPSDVVNQTKQKLLRIARRAAQ